VFQPGVQDLTIYQGTSWSLNVKWRINEFDVDMTGWTARMQIRTDAASADVVIELNTENGRISLTELPGWAVLRLNQKDTNLPSTRYAYDLVVDDGQSTFPLIRGRVAVKGGVTEDGQR
jgi:hypothetical protein